MSRYYEISVVVEGYSKERQAAIAKAAEEEWAGLGNLADNARFCLEKGWIMEAYAEGSLCGGEEEKGFAESLAKSIWQANKDFCNVEVRATYLEDLPYEEYSFGKEQYRVLMTEDLPGAI